MKGKIGLEEHFAMPDTAVNPRGTYAAQALGRQMVLVHKLRGADAARPIAREYMARFPSGPYAEPAKKLLQD